MNVATSSNLKTVLPNRDSRVTQNAHNLRSQVKAVFFFFPSNYTKTLMDYWTETNPQNTKQEMQLNEWKITHLLPNLEDIHLLEPSFFLQNAYAKTNQHKKNFLNTRPNLNQSDTLSCN